MESSLGKRRGFRKPDRYTTLLSRQVWISLFVFSIYLYFSHFCFLSLSVFGSVLLPFSQYLPCCALYNFFLHNESFCLLFHRRRGFVKSTWISSIFCPIIPLFYSPPPHLSLWVSLLLFTYLPPRGFPLLLKVVCFTNQSPTCHSLCLPHPPSLYQSPSLSHSVPVSLALNQSVSLSLWRLGNTFLFQTARSDLLPGSSSGGWLVSSSAPPPVAAPTAVLSKS